MDFSETFIAEAVDILGKLQTAGLERMVGMLADTRRRGGRVFVLGVGGSAASASHLVNDLRKIAKIEAYAPTDNVAELTARVNDEGWGTSFTGWLEGSRLRKRDAVLVLSVGGGDARRNISPNLVHSLDYCRRIGATILGIVGRDGGHTAKIADCCIIVPTVNADHVTAHTEAFHSVIGHLIVTHPKLKALPTKWESAVNTSAGRKESSRGATRDRR